MLASRLCATLLLPVVLCLCVTHLCCNFSTACLRAGLQAWKETLPERNYAAVHHLQIPDVSQASALHTWRVQRRKRPLGSIRSSPGKARYCCACSSSRVQCFLFLFLPHTDLCWGSMSPCASPMAWMRACGFISSLRHLVVLHFLRSMLGLSSLLNVALQQGRCLAGCFWSGAAL